MKKLLSILFLILASCSIAKSPERFSDTAQPIFGHIIDRVMPYGQDTLGAAKYKDVVLKNLHAHEGQGHFTNTFGDALPLIKVEAAKSVEFIRLHLMWKDAHDFSEKDFPAIVKEAKRVCPVINANPMTHWYLSGACEHQLSEQNARQLAHLVEAACPQATYVNTPMGNRGAILPEYINEMHGGGNPRSLKYAFSFDGTAAEDSDIETVKKNFPNAEYFFIWGPRYNGRWESNDHTPRPERKGWPDSKYMQSLHYLETAKGSTSLPKKYLWKSHAENHGPGDTKAEHPVAIFPVKTNSVILKRDNKIVANLPYYGPYADGRSRYYFLKGWGYDLGRVDVFINGKNVGNINGGFRDGDYRQ